MLTSQVLTPILAPKMEESVVFRDSLQAAGALVSLFQYQTTPRKAPIVKCSKRLQRVRCTSAVVYDVNFHAPFEQGQFMNL